MFSRVKIMFLEPAEDNVLDRVKATADKLNISTETDSHSFTDTAETSSMNITIESTSEHSLNAVYDKGAFDEANSIYKVDTFDKTLPVNAMPADVRKETLKNIILAAGYDINALTADYLKRVEWLNKYKTHYIESETVHIERINSEINEFQRQIDVHLEDIATRNASINDLNVLVSSSIADLERIYKSIN